MQTIKATVEVIPATQAFAPDLLERIPCLDQTFIVAATMEFNHKKFGMVSMVPGKEHMAEAFIAMHMACVRTMVELGAGDALVMEMEVNYEAAETAQRRTIDSYLGSLKSGSAH